MTHGPTRRLLLALGAALLVGGLALGEDGGAGDPNAAPDVSFSEDVQPFLTQNCYACHLTGSASAGLAVEPGAAFDNLVGVASTQSDLARVEPGEPGASYLLHKLRGTHVEAGGSGARMPLGGGAASEEAIDAIEAWIEAGAPQN